MKKFRAAALALAGILVFSLAVSAQPQVQDGEDIIRIHIRAHDDSAQEQEIKGQVRDAVNLYLEPILNGCLNKEEAERALNECIPKLEEIGQEVSGREVTASLRREEFPQRTYGDVVYPAGEYEALIIEIGAGQGANWWCVAFPPVCYASVSKSPSATDSPGATVKVKYRSWIWERLQKLFKSGG